MGGLVRWNRLLKHDTVRLEMQLFALLLVEKRIRGKKDQPGPALAVTSRHLRQGQVTIGIGSKAIGIILNGARSSLSDCHFSACRGWTTGYDQLTASINWAIGTGFNHLNFGSREISLHSGCSVALDRDVSRLQGRDFVFAQVKSR